MSRKHKVKGPISLPAHEHPASEAPAPHGSAHEEAQHVEHASHDQFSRRVAITMVMVAAVLAAVKVLGHRAHNDTLLYQIEANVKRAQAASKRTEKDTKLSEAGLYSVRASAERTESSNQWAYFQAKKLRQHFYEIQAKLIEVQSQGKPGASAELAALAKEWQANAERYGKEVIDIQKSAEAAKAKADDLEKEAKKIENDTHKLEHEAERLDEEAEKQAEKSHLAHHQSDRFDLGEMGVELALVLCSVAILTKRAGFWFAGIALGILGTLIAASVYVPLISS